MAKDFDTEPRRTWSEEERAFVIRGERFVARAAVRPETLALYEDRLKEGGQTFTNLIETTDHVLLALIEGGDEVQEAPGPMIAGPEIPDPENDGEMIEGPLIQGPPVMVPVPGSARARYFAVRAITENPVTLPDLQRVIEWLFEVHAVRPTGSSGGSSNGAGGSGASSTDSSSAPALPPVPTV